MSRVLPWACLLVAAAGCKLGDDARVAVTIVARPELVPGLGAIAALTDDHAVTVVAAEDPVTTDPPDRDARVIHVAIDLACVECYRIDAASGGGDHAWIVHAGDPLGAEYGAAAALEDLGFRFRSPYESYAPWAPRFDPAAAADLGVPHAPEVRVRGLQLHTIHPIEAYFALWEPGAQSLAEADRIFAWIVANRGNYVQWVALNDILDPARHAEWQAQTATLIEHAHALGLRAGLNIQLFGQSDKQNGFDLSSDTTGTVPLATELAARIPLVTDGVPFDAYELSFGEFFNSDPDRFIASVNEAVAALHAHAPAAEIHALVHVGADHRITYLGKSLIYYFLVAYCDPLIIPDIHTVMFYDLYEDAGGAYDHQDFSEHRAYLLDRIASGKPAAYFPETTYWVAFDDSVPLYLPLYVRSRWLDLDRLAADPAAGGRSLDEHLIFSSGWEWGYWLGDYTALRASYQRPAAYKELVAHAFAGDLAAAVDPVVDLIEDQRATLLESRLIAYLAGRDLALDFARDLKVVAQPERVTFKDLAAADATERAAFAADIPPRLAALADELDVRAHAVDRLDLDGPWADELRDGFQITALRARFAAVAYPTALAQLAGDTPAYQRGLASLQSLLSRAQVITARRRAALHSPTGSRYVEPTPNHTLYQYGYLEHADTLCYWVRELRQLQQLGGGTERVPDCLL